MSGKQANLTRPTEAEFKKAMTFLANKSPHTGSVMLRAVRWLEMQNRQLIEELDRLRAPRKPRRWWQFWRAS